MTYAPTDKTTPTKIRIDENGWICCPRCDDTFYLLNMFSKRNNYCGRCGQALDWTDIHEPKYKEETK